MENWGFITGRSNALAIDANSEDLRTKKDIAYTQCHEVAHMWYVVFCTFDGSITYNNWVGLATSQLWNGGITFISTKVSHCYRDSCQYSEFERPRGSGFATLVSSDLCVAVHNGLMNY